MALRKAASVALWVCLVVQGAAVQAGDRSAVEKLKTGILPGGGFYSLYNVRCPDGRDASVASLDRRTRWCTLQGEELLCGRSAREIGARACGAESLAALAGSEEDDYGAP